MSDPFVIGLAVAGWLASTWLAYRWGLHSQKMQRVAAAHSNLRIAFSEIRARAVDGSIRHSWVAASIGDQESAVTEFRAQLAGRDRQGFDRACEAYRQYRKPPFDSTHEPGRLGGPPRGYGLGAFEQAILDTFTSRQRQDLVHAVDDLLSYADKT